MSFLRLSNVIDQWETQGNQRTKRLKWPKHKDSDEEDDDNSDDTDSSNEEESAVEVVEVLEAVQAVQAVEVVEVVVPKKTNVERPLDSIGRMLLYLSCNNNSDVANSNEKECVVCLQNRCNVLVRPCRHVPYCVLCLRTILTDAKENKKEFACCAICQTRIQSIETIFM